MTGKFQGNVLSLTALNGDPFFDFGKGLHIAPVQIATAFLLVHVEVFLIDGEDGKAEGDLIVMTNGDTGRAGRHANHYTRSV